MWQTIASRLFNEFRDGDIHLFGIDLHYRLASILSMSIRKGI